MPTTAELRTTRLSDKEIGELIAEMAAEAQSFVESELVDDIEKATDYYMARPFGTEEEGRSSVVMPVVRDAVNDLMPSLLRVFVGNVDGAVRFRPKGREDVEKSQLRTNYVNHILLEQNPGFMILRDAFNDALVRRLGVVTWWPEHATAINETMRSGLTEEAMEVLLDDPNVTLDVEQQEDGTYKGSVKRRRTARRIKVDTVPTEDMIWNRTARRFTDAQLIGHITEVTAADLIAMGISEKKIMGLGARPDPSNAVNAEDARRIDEGSSNVGEEKRDSLQRPVMLTRVFVQLVLDPEEEAEPQLIEAKLGGPDFQLLEWEPVSHVRYATFEYDPQPHTTQGLSVWDYTKDLQDIESDVMRGTLDSLAETLDQQKVVTGGVNVNDLTDRKRHRIVRADSTDSVREVEHRFVGRDTLPFMEFLDTLRNKRIPKPMGALDKDAMQSTTRTAVTESVAASRSHVEMVARIFAETGMRQLFRGLLKTVIENPNVEEEVELNNQWVTIDPTEWDPEQDVTINVGLGTSVREEQIASLLQVLAKQEQIWATLGPGNPLVGLAKIRASLARLSQLADLNPDDHWNQYTEEDERQDMQAAMQEEDNQESSDPNAAIAQAEMVKAQAQAAKAQSDAQSNAQKVQIELQKIALEERKIALEDDRERDRVAGQLAIELRKLNTDAEVKVTVAEIQAEAKALRENQNQGDSDGE